jgi:hypothetical protein
MRDVTLCTKTTALAGSPLGWRVYRIQTQNSLYELEVQDAPRQGARRCAVLRCLEPRSRAGEAYEDSSPLVGTRSLFDVSPLEWIGARLFIGTAETSLVQEVDFVTSRAEPHAPTAPKAAPRPSPWERFPDGYVELAETTAGILKGLCHCEDLFFAVRSDTLLERRLQLALAQCRLMLDAMKRRE